MWSWLLTLRDKWTRTHGPLGRVIPDTLWRSTLRHYPFLERLAPEDRLKLRVLVGKFLQHKEFNGANGLVITDAMAVAIAAQACLPVLHLPGGLDWYADFVGIVVQPAEVLARREAMDDSGVVHYYSEVLTGEAMEHGPVMLSWQDVAASGRSAVHGHNVVIHEFVHKIDMNGGPPTGCPSLPHGFMGTQSVADAHRAWMGILEPAYEAFREKVIHAERFSGAPVWLDPYGAESIVEFFAVTCEAYFVNRERFAQEFTTLPALFDAFFQPERMK